MQSYPAYRHFLPLRSKYSPQQPVLKHPQYMFPLKVQDRVSHPLKSVPSLMLIIFAVYAIIHGKILPYLKFSRR